MEQQNVEQNVEQQYVDCTKRRCNPSETKVQPNIGLVKLQFYATSVLVIDCEWVIARFHWNR